jgi:hypothetical protein
MAVISNLPFFVVVNDKKNNVIKSVNQQFHKTFVREFNNQESIEILLKKE